MSDHEGENCEEEITKSTFGFPILDVTQDVNMKNISPSSLPNFHGKSTEDLDTFLFEFGILCRSYNYVTDAQKLKLFPATLKDSALRWFMGLEEHSIVLWDGMRGVFLKKYQDYCKPKYFSNDHFKMQQHNDESLEDYVEHFLYIL